MLGYPFPCGTEGQPPCPPVECIAALQKLSEEEQAAIWAYVTATHVAGKEAGVLSVQTAADAPAEDAQDEPDESS